MPHGEGADRHFVDQPARQEQRRGRRHRPGNAIGDGLWHQRSGVVAVAAPCRQPRIIDDRAGRSRSRRGPPAACRDRTTGRAAPDRIRRPAAKAVARLRRARPGHEGGKRPVLRQRSRLDPVRFPGRPTSNRETQTRSAVSERTEKRMPSSVNESPRRRSSPGHPAIMSGDDARLVAGRYGCGSGDLIGRRDQVGKRRLGLDAVAPRRARSARDRRAAWRPTCRCRTGGRRCASRLRTGCGCPGCWLTEPSTGS